MTRENTGPHAIPPPPFVPRDPFGPAPESDPPFTSKGASWKTIAAALGVVATIIGSTITLSYQIGERAAEQRARDAEQTGQLEVITRRIERIGNAREHDREELTAHRERLASHRERIDALEREINKRRDRSAVHD